MKVVGAIKSQQIAATQKRNLIVVEYTTSIQEAFNTGFPSGGYS